jgi:hypothetical protein
MRRRRSRWAAWLGVAMLGLACRSTAPAAIAAASALTGPATATCFPVETLPPADRRLAEQVLLEFGDREGLYTLAGGLKPISSDVRDVTLRVAPTLDTAALGTLEQLRRVSAALTCGDLGVFVQLFTATQRLRDSSEVRNTSLVLFHRGGVRRTIIAHRDFFASLGVTPAADPREVVLAVENAPRSARWRGYGYLFGYPDDAVDFFVRAGEEGDATRTLVPRDFRRIETWHTYPAVSGGPPTLSSFVFAVPKGSDESADERRLRAAAAPIFSRYARERGTAIRGDSTGAVALWRRWLSAP